MLIQKTRRSRYCLSSHVLTRLSPSHHLSLPPSDQSIAIELGGLVMRSKRLDLSLPLIALAFSLFMTATALAQSSATLQGTVSDSKGALVPNATVTARNKGTSLRAVTVAFGTKAPLESLTVP